MVIHCMVQEGVAPDLAAFLGPALGQDPCPRVRFTPDPAVNAVSAAVGMRPSFLMSTWIMSPGQAYSERRARAGPRTLIPVAGVGMAPN
ncbi:hypothetical protein DXK94_21150 [Arthrobacter sp. RT-1]|nr:hypothetical protein DXK94_21150 [Arthrobacter sp. RT-1]